MLNSLCPLILTLKVSSICFTNWYVLCFKTTYFTLNIEVFLLSNYQFSYQSVHFKGTSFNPAKTVSLPNFNFGLSLIEALYHWSKIWDVSAFPSICSSLLRSLPIWSLNKQFIQRVFLYHVSQNDIQPPTVTT